MIDEDAREYLVGFQARMRAARTALGWSQEFLAEALGLPLETYKKYENRSPMPLHLVGKFCELTQTEIHHFVTGRRRATRAGVTLQSPKRKSPGS